MKTLLQFILLQDIDWWRWKGRVKFLLWLVTVLGVIGWGLVRLDESSHELFMPETFVKH